MKSRSSFMAFGGAVVLAGGLILTANAQAYGSAQWRPAQGYAPTPAAVQVHRRPMAHTRQFRPWVAAPAQPVQNPVPSYAMRPTNNPYAAPRQSYRSARYDRPSARPLAQNYPGGFAATSYRQDWRYPTPGTMAPVWHGGWGQAYPIAQTWGQQGWYQPPMFARQYGWQPMVQPWVARQPVPASMPRQVGYQPRVYQSQRYQPQVPVADRRFRSHHQGSGFANNTAPAYGSWRPAPVLDRERYDRQVAARQQAVYRPHQPTSAPTWAMPPAPPVHGMPLAQPGQWRPGTGSAAPPIAYHWQSSPSEASFRPPAYGRSQPLDQRVADQRWRGSRKDRTLPGWVTTYPDLGESVACTWCGGS